MSHVPDLAGLLATLDRHGVAFVVAGSVGALAHGAAGVDPGDLDIVPATDAANLRRLAASLASLSAEPAIDTGAWTTDAHGEHRWVEDGVERRPRPLDPDDPDTSTIRSAPASVAWMSCRGSPAHSSVCGPALRA